MLGDMAKLVLTVVGDDRAGLVKSLAEVIGEHGGNWETSELAELAGAFAGIVLVSVPDGRLEEMTTALQQLDGLLRVSAYGRPDSGAVHGGPDAGARPARRLTFTVLGNDRPGIVRDVTSTLTGHGLTIDLFSSRTREAPMAGGLLFEATVAVRVAEGFDERAVIEDLERLAGEIQVDLTVER
jgi:glycine cleavage system regulatory protein